VLGVFTGAPVLQVKVGGTGKPGTAAAAAVEGVERGDDGEQAAEELWGNIVSWWNLQGAGELLYAAMLPFKYKIDTCSGITTSIW